MMANTNATTTDDGRLLGLGSGGQKALVARRRVALNAQDMGHPNFQPFPVCDFVCHYPTLTHIDPPT